MKGYDRLSRVFHWLVALLILVTIPVGIAMTSEGFGGISDALYITHKNLGVVIGVVLALRWLWRLVGPEAPPLAGDVSAREERVARWTHRILYLLVAVMVVTGYLRVVAGDFPVELLDALGVPPLISDRPELSTALSVVHKYSAYLLVAVVADHVSAVLYHAVILEDGTLSRMWPPWRRDARDPAGTDAGAPGSRDSAPGADDTSSGGRG